MFTSDFAICFMERRRQYAATQAAAEVGERLLGEVVEEEPRHSIGRGSAHDETAQSG